MLRSPLLAAASFAVGLLAPSAALAQDACPVSGVGLDVGGELTRSFLFGSPFGEAGPPVRVQDVAGSPWTREAYGSAPDLPGVAFGRNRGFGPDLLVARTSGPSLVEGYSALFSGGAPAILAARVGGSSDPAQLPTVQIDWIDGTSTVVRTDVAAPQPCPEQDGAVTVWRALVPVQRPEGASSYRVVVASRPGVTSFVDGVSLANPRWPGAPLVVSPRDPDLRLTSVRREDGRLRVQLRASTWLLRPIDLRVTARRAGRARTLRGRAAVPVVAPTTTRRLGVTTRSFRLPGALRRGPLTVTATYPGDAGFGPGRATRSLRG